MITGKMYPGKVMLHGFLYFLMGVPCFLSVLICMLIINQFTDITEMIINYTGLPKFIVGGYLGNAFMFWFTNKRWNKLHVNLDDKQ